jgi:hypothetical protein
LVDVGSITLAVLGIAILWKFKKIQEPVWILAAIVLGLIIKMFI